MEDELNLDNIEVQVEEKLKVKNRFEQLSEKVILTSREKDEALAKAQTEADARQSVEKERDFYKDFSTHASNYPGATEYQNQIWDKVKSGYSTEDAMVSVLNKEGKLTASSPEARPTIQAEGGSAPTSFEGEKTLDNMSVADKLAALQEVDKSGALGALLRGSR